MDDKLSENEILRTKIKELTDAIENAKSKPAWQRDKGKQYFDKNQPTPKFNSNYSTSLSTSKYRHPTQALDHGHHHKHLYSPYAGGLHKDRKNTAWEHAYKDTSSLKAASSHKFSSKPRSTVNGEPWESAHSKGHFQVFSSNSRPTEKARIPYTSNVDISVPKPHVNVREHIIKGNSSVDQQEFQQKVDKMKTTIAELQKALSEKRLASSLNQKSGSGKVADSSSSALLFASNYQDDCSKLVHKPLKHIEKSVTSIPRSSSEPCISAMNIEHHIASKSSVWHTSNHHYLKSAHSSQSGRTFDGKYGSAINTKHSQFGEKSHMFYDSTSDSQGSDSEFISISKYKLARLNSSPTKTLKLESLNLSSSKSTKTESRPHDGFVHLQNKSSTGIFQANSETVKSLPETSKKEPKFLHKSKYSLQRAKSHSNKSLSIKKSVSQGSSTTTKFIALSKFAIKRVRRSLSDESQNGASGRSSSGTSIESMPYKHQADWSDGGTARSCDSYYSSFDKAKQYKRDQSIRFSQRYRTRKGFYQKKYQFAYNHQYHSKKVWKYNGYHNSKIYRRNQRSILHTHHGSRFGNTTGQRKHHRHYTWNATSDSHHRPCTRYISRRIQQLKQQIPFNPKHKLDRRNISHKPADVNIVVINGLLYKSSSKKLVKATPARNMCHDPVKNTLSGGSMNISPGKESVTGVKNVTIKDMKTVSVRGIKFKVDKHGKSLTRITQPEVKKADSAKVRSPRVKAKISRIDIGGVTYMQTKPGTLERVNSVKSRVAAVRVVNKTIQRAAGKYKKDNTKVLSKKKYCMFFNRFGKCNRKDKCPYIHDSDKIAVCTRFLRGTCKSKDCPFSHKVSGNKVPTCSYFVMGKCSRTDCPYPHVNVNREAAVCEDFLKGFCPAGVKCKKKHILQCPEYFHTGVCSQGNKCKLQHKKVKEKKQHIVLRPEEKSVSISTGVISSEKDPDTCSPLDVSSSSKDPDTCIALGQTSLSTNPDMSILLGPTPSSAEPDMSVITWVKSSNTPAGSSDESVSSSPLSRKRKLPAYISLKTSNSSTSSVVEIKEKEQSLNEKNTMKIRPEFI